MKAYRFLINNGGLNSGLMIAQYTAAALVSENKTLATPASVDSIPSSANQEDHVSMGTIAARKAMKIVENTRNVLAIELLCATQAIDLRVQSKRNFPKLARGTKAVYDLVHEKVMHIQRDRVLSNDIDILAKIISSEELVKRVENKIGQLILH